MPIDTRQLLGAVALAGTSLLLGACGAQEPWQAVQTYIDVDTKWHEEMNRIARSDDSPEAKAKAREGVGPHPDITDAVAAARGILDVPGHARRIDAAEFLVEHTFGLSETAADDLALGIDILVAEIGSGLDGGRGRTGKRRTIGTQRARRSRTPSSRLTTKRRGSMRSARTRGSSARPRRPSPWPSPAKERAFRKRRRS